ncbi:CAP domain-containing protein [Cryptosporangium phraense]|uniref:CAP domain-containing protein n=1 Tax=Cryptosporangium phraense TaxID=2593070 RepID=UPI0014785EF2|nr:CAP domain-containing protein [Cryptosporangium phraense]
MSHRRAPSRVRLWVGGVVVVAAVATAGIAVTGLVRADEGSGGDKAAIEAAETVAPPAVDDPTPCCAPTSSAGSSASSSASPGSVRPRLPGGSPTAATGRAPSSPKPSPRPSATRKTSPPSSTTTGSAEQRVLAVINAARAENGAGPLSMSSGLVASAHDHNLVMADGCGLSHQCDGEGGLGDRISAAGVDWRSVAENIGTGGPVADTESAQGDMAVRLTNDMLAEVPPDDGHRKNILNPDLSRIGIDVIIVDGTVWLTHDFAN